MTYHTACEQARAWAMNFACPFFVVRIAEEMYDVVARAACSDRIVARFS